MSFTGLSLVKAFPYCHLRLKHNIHYKLKSSIELVDRSLKINRLHERSYGIIGVTSHLNVQSCFYCSSFQLNKKRFEYSVFYGRSSKHQKISDLICHLFTLLYCHCHHYFFIISLEATARLLELTVEQRSMKEENMSENIFLFAPNLIGYARILLALISFYYMPIDHVVACWCYIISGLLDAFDGYAARYFDQSTKFGAMLDQLTDRCGTMCLLVTLSYFYPRYMFLFQLSMTIDIACHWIHLHTTLLQGKTSHKFFDLSDNPIMRIYYTSRVVLFCMCAGNEAFYASLYLLHFTEGPSVLGIGIFRLVCYISAPVAIVKSLIALLQGYIACRNLGAVDLKERETLRVKEK